VHAPIRRSFQSPSCCVSCTCFTRTHSRTSLSTLSIRLYKTVPAKPNNRPSTVSLRERQFEEQQGENSLANMELPPWQRLQQALFGIAQLEKREDAPTVANEGSTDSEDAEDSFAPKSCLRRSTRHKKNVSFSTVDIHYHKVELGDNPAVSFGPPLARRWEAHGHVRHGLDEYEANTKRRNRKDLLIPGFVRNRLLQQAGYSIYDIEVARSSAEDIRLSRKVNARDGWWNRKRRRRGKYDDDGIVVVNWGQFWGWLLGNREDDDATVASACTR